jgi:Spy/CpxP family protein refolding chaperone
MPRRLLSRLLLPLSLSLVVPAFGCGGTTAAESAASADSATTRAPVAVNAQGHLKVIGLALGDVPLTAAQRAQIEKLAADAEVRHAGVNAARKELMLALAAQVQAGQLDRAALQPKLDALVSAMKLAQPGDRAAFEQLHAILGPDQRTAFVDALEAHIGERIGQVREKHPLKRWADDLKLTDDQKAQIKTAMQQRFQAAAHDPNAAPHWAEAKEHGAKVLGAFKQDRFVMDEVSPARDVGEKATKMADHFLGMAETVLPLLTPDQRVLAAQKLRERADQADELGAGMP